MLGRIMFAGGSILLAIALFFGLQPQSPYLNYAPLPEPESYFPVTPEGEVKVWYARRNIARMGLLLQAFEEPTLYYTIDGEAEWAVRFIFVSQHGDPIVARVRPTDDGIALVVKHAAFDTAGNMVGRVTARERQLSAREATALQDELNALSFFDLAGPLPETDGVSSGLGTGGAGRSRGDLWGIEWRSGPEDGAYHLVIRDSRVDLTRFEALALDLFGRAGLAPTFAAHPVVDYDAPKDTASIEGAE